MKLIWNEPEAVPVVTKGKEEPYWIAVMNDKGKVFVFMAYYQNRLSECDEYGNFLSDDYLMDLDGDPVSSIGWVDARQRVDFDDYWQAMEFNDNYKLIGWAEYTPPEFTGVSA